MSVSRSAAGSDAGHVTSPYICDDCLSCIDGPVVLHVERQQSLAGRQFIVLDLRRSRFEYRVIRYQACLSSPNTRPFSIITVKWLFCYRAGFQDTAHSLFESQSFGYIPCKRQHSSTQRASTDAGDKRFNVRFYVTLLCIKNYVSHISYTDISPCRKKYRFRRSWWKLWL